VRKAVTAVVTGVCALILVGWRGAPPVAAVSVRPVMPGFTAQQVGTMGAAVCGGQGPTALARVGAVLFVATDRGLYYTKSGGLSSFGTNNQAAPWGLAGLGGKLYATEPRCGVAVANDPVNGSNCRVIEVGPSNGRVLRVVADVCGYGLVADPSTGTLTVAGRNGQVVSVQPSNGAVSPLLSAPAVSLDWSADGRRLYMADSAKAVSVWDRSARRPVAGASALGLAAGTPALGLDGSVLTGSAGAVKASPGGDVAATGEQASALLATSDGVYAAFKAELWLLRGRYTPVPPPGPKGTAPPTTARPRVVTNTTVPRAAVAAPAQAPPPPPPPAPPVPPLATATQAVAQPSAVANPAIVPGESEREAALRLAATGLKPPVPPTVLWLALAGVVCLGGFGVGRAATRRSQAWARSA
jgi:hypothetical protein